MELQTGSPAGRSGCTSPLKGRVMISREYRGAASHEGEENISFIVPLRCISMLSGVRGSVAVQCFCTAPNISQEGQVLAIYPCCMCTMTLMEDRPGSGVQINTTKTRIVYDLHRDEWNTSNFGHEV